ncbi:unnamed protein product [Ilex paraguariensis]|uniref:Uncharacterized protein n=1 Tax=Ilex paraguariensis TaxID=185542 RepID=A0ABC8RZ07_9AQUA
MKAQTFQSPNNQNWMDGQRQGGCRIDKASSSLKQRRSSKTYFQQCFQGGVARVGEHSSFEAFMDSMDILYERRRRLFFIVLPVL